MYPNPVSAQDVRMNTMEAGLLYQNPTHGYQELQGEFIPSAPTPSSSSVNGDNQSKIDSFLGDHSSNKSNIFLVQNIFAYIFSFFGIVLTFNIYAYDEGDFFQVDDFFIPMVENVVLGFLGMAYMYCMKEFQHSLLGIFFKYSIFFAIPIFISAQLKVVFQNIKNIPRIFRIISKQVPNVLFFFIENLEMLIIPVAISAVIGILIFYFKGKRVFILAPFTTFGLYVGAFGLSLFLMFFFPFFFFFLQLTILFFTLPFTLLYNILQ